MEKEVHNKNNNGLRKAKVDIDETICTYLAERIYEHAMPDLDNIAKINKMFDEGWIIVYSTSRGSSQVRNAERMRYLETLTRKQLTDWGAKHHHLEIGLPLYDLVIDDKAKRIEEI